MKKIVEYVIAVFFICTGYMSFAQTKVDTVYIKYLSSTINTTKDSASYFRVRTISNGILKADDYSMQDSSLKCSAYYEKFYPYIKEGYCIYYSPLIMGGMILGRSEGNYLNDKEDGLWKYYYASGELCYTQKYIKGKRNELISYYKTGEIKRIEQYEEGNQVKRQCYTRDGKDTAYYDMFIWPRFPGGEKAQQDYVLHHIIYSKQARMNKIEGTVFVWYVVNADGSISDVEVVKGKGAHPLLDQAAVDCIKKMPAMTPGYIDGIPVKVRMVQKIKFTLQQ